MPFQPSKAGDISPEESEALARFVHDLESRMEPMANLLNERGTPDAAILAASISHDLRLLEDLLAPAAGEMISDVIPAYLSTSQ